LRQMSRPEKSMMRGSSKSLARAGPNGTQTQHKHRAAAERTAAQTRRRQLTEQTLDCYKISLQSKGK